MIRAHPTNDWDEVRNDLILVYVASYIKPYYQIYRVGSLVGSFFSQFDTYIFNIS